MINSFEMVDQIGSILKENPNGQFQDKIKDLYFLGSYLTYCYEADVETHMQIFAPLYDDYQSSWESVNVEEQFDSIMDLLQEYRKQITETNAELDVRAAEFAEDCLGRVSK
jgi:hypothetical protein